ncbi:MAG: LPS assembly protein LptD [Kiritimatiellae bacterium]|nr:LPS assembly protein LptD [Kiritimatiellia bacterium]
MKRFLTASAVLCAALCSFATDPGALRAVSRSFRDGDGKTDVMADTAEYSFAKSGPDAGWTTFSGNAAIRRGGWELRADRIRYNSETGDAEAIGNVALVGDDGTLWKGDSLAINMRDKAGRADGIDLYAAPFRVLAQDGGFLAPTSTNQAYVIRNATLTTCTNEPGRFHWAVSAGRARIRPGDDVTGWDVVPHLFGVPFFFYPYYWKDLSRHYGFRFQPGYTHKWGAFLLSTYKLPILNDKRNDAYIDSYTFGDYRTERGFAFGEKVSWSFGDDESHGYITGYMIPKDEDLPKVLDQDETERHRVRFLHYWNATDRDQVLAHALYVSDSRVQRDFFRKEYREAADPDNDASYTHYGDAFSAGIEASFRLNDFQSRVERLPEAWFSLNAVELGDTGVYLENDTALSFLHRRFGESDEVNDANGNPRALRTPADDYDAFRGDTHFTLSHPAKYWGFLSVVPRLGWRGTYYDKTMREIVSTETVTTSTTNELGRVSSQTEEKTLTRTEEDDADFRSVFEIGAEVSTRAYGFWDDSAGDRWRHVVEPYSDWSVIPEPNVRPYRLYQFDSIDRIDSQNALRLGLRQRWQRKRPDGSTREIFYADFYADFDFETDGDEDVFRDVGWDLRWRPASWLRLSTKGLYDEASGDVSSAEAVATATHDIFRCDVEYQFRNDENSLFSGYLSWYANEHWGFDIFGRYEFEESQVEEIGGWVQYSWDCIAMRLVASVEPAYKNADGIEEEADWRISLVGWLTDFVPPSVMEEDNR